MTAAGKFRIGESVVKQFKESAWLSYWWVPVLNHSVPLSENMGECRLEGPRNDLIVNNTNHRI